MNIVKQTFIIIIATGWRRLALVMLALWEAYWIIAWRSATELANLRAAEDFAMPIYPASDPDFDLAMAQKNLAFWLISLSPLALIVMFVVGKWIIAGFRRDVSTLHS